MFRALNESAQASEDRDDPVRLNSTQMPSGLADIVARLDDAHDRRRAVVVGDYMLDRYLFGKTGRVSPEAPIPVLHFQREEDRLGGTGFVVAALVALGVPVRAVGAVGPDDAGRKLRQKLGELAGVDVALVDTPGRPTVEKVRLLGSSEDRAHQQMIRLDVENPTPLDGDAADALVAAAVDGLDGAGALVLEDYDKGVLSPDVCGRLIAAARERGVPVLVDPARVDDFGKYRGATLLKANRIEAERCVGGPVRTADQVDAAATKMLADLDLDALIITLNDEGSHLATIDGERGLLESRPRQVADATGAGDTVLAALCAARLVGASWHDALALANVAAGLEVERLGCVPVTAQEIAADLRGEHARSGAKHQSLDRLRARLSRERAAGRRIVFTNGCFDLLHLGHVSYFRYAKAQGDLLVVGVNTDASIRRLKGDKRPIASLDDRLGVLAELESIDYLVTFDTDTPLELIEAIRPDVLVKGADYQKEQVVGWEIVERTGGRVALAPLVEGRSTSNVIGRIIDAYGST